MFNKLIGFFEIMFDESVLRAIKWWHILLGIFIIIFGFIMFTFSFLYYLPKYMTYLELEDMKRTMLWTETHERAAMEIGPILQKYPEYSKFILYYKNDSLDEISMADEKKVK